MSITSMQAEIGMNNIAKGWRSLATSVGDRLALVHSEVTEALEEIRAGHAPDEIYYGQSVTVPVETLRVVLAAAESNAARDKNDPTWDAWWTCREAIQKSEAKPEGYPVELADAMIRILDEFDRYGMDAESVIRLKMDYNTTRSFRHGGKAL